MSRLLRYAFALLAFPLIGCGGGNSGGSATAAPAEFANPQRVIIAGYADDAMEPFISRDGRYLFFNNLNEAPVNTNLYWAERIDDLQFQFKGEIGGVNTPALEGVASMDRNNVFYFVSTRSYDQSLSTLYRGTFSNGRLEGIELVPGVSTKVPGMVNFDAEISPDGNTLYFVDSKFGASGPAAANIVIAERSGAAFVRASNSADIMRNINTAALQYAPAISASGLEIFFTRLDGNSPAIYTATRADAASPFGSPKTISAISGLVEAPTLSPDEKSLYYHKKEDGRYVIYRVTRP